MGIEPKRYRARFIEPGVISYEDIGAGLVLVGRQALDRMRPSFVGMPVFNFVHKDVEADEAFDFENAAKESLAVGIISGVGTGDDGWDWADMMIWDEETQTNIETKGFTVSCAYDTIKSAPPGKHNGIAYDEEVLDGKYVHMAIVDNPRYEGSTVVRNSKGGPSVAGETKPKKGWFFTKKNAEPSEDDKKNAEEGLQAPEGEGGAYMVIDGQKIPVEELIACAEGEMENADDGAIAPEDEVTSPSGKKYTGAELLAMYKAKKGGEGGTTENGVEIDGGEAGKTTIKKNADGTPAKEAPNEHFITVKKNAAAAAAEHEVPKPVTRQDRYKLGQERYGSPVAAGGK